MAGPVGLLAALLTGMALNAASAQGLGAAEPVEAGDVQFEQAQQTKTLAVLFRADWCAQCHVLEPKIEAARALLEASGGGAGVSYVTLDFTSAASRLQASEAAVRHGVERVFTERAGKTGFMLVIDAESGAVESEISSVYEPDVIAHVLEASAAADR